MRHRRPVLAALVGLAATLLVGSGAGTSAPEPAPRPVAAAGTADSAAPPEFLAPLFVLPAPAGTPGGDGDVLTPGTVVTPVPEAPRPAPRAEFRPA